MEDLPSAFADVTSSIPGYGIIAQILLNSFGVDASKLVSKYIILFAFYKVTTWLWDKVYNFLQDHITSVVEIDDDDTLYFQLFDWIAKQPMTKNSKGIKADTSKSENLSEHDDNWDSIDSDCDDDVLDEEGLFSYERWDSKNPIIYKPNTQREFFTFNGRWFQWSKDQRQNTDGRSIDRLVFVRCLGRSTEPIKEFLTHIRTWSRNKEVKATEVYRSSKRANERGVEWSRQSVRPSRPLDTVSLDDEQKTKIVADINEYLLPATARWYAVRGIPHRRGYLFHGPPGTGKTSLSFSLAGIFGLAIYCISLSEMALTESDLGTLFRRLPKRCIVLLEDIDSAGLRREDDALIPAIKSSDGSDSESGSGGKTTGASMSLISLAGLLNVIDGAGSHEGRVLIMTTNYPEQLDPALIRPGRVDLKINFTLATRDQICDIFKRMYSTELDEGKPNTEKSPITSATSLTLANNDSNKLLAIEPGKIAELATQFASSLPEKIFSPAEIQGFLLMKKTDPEGAIKEVGKWKDAQIVAKKNRKNVVESSS